METPSGQTWRPRAWCALAGIGKATLYEAWAEGRGPRTVVYGRTRLILESPREFFERVGETDAHTARAA